MKVAWFQGDIEDPDSPSYMSMEEILALPETSPMRPVLKVLLVPDDFDLSLMWGDDWNDAPANCNAGEPYDRTLPDGAVWLYLHAGSEWPRINGRET